MHIFRKKKPERQREELLTLAEACQDRCIRTDLEEVCRGIRFRILQWDGNEAEYDRMRGVLADSLSLLDDRRMYEAELNLKSLKHPAAGGRTEEPGGGSMGLIGKLKGKLVKREEEAQGAIMDGEEREAEARIREIERRIAALYDRHAAMLAQFERNVKRCAGLDRKSPAYQQLRQQALMLLPRIKSTEKQLTLYAQQLENSSRYQALVELGRSTFELQKYMPDASRTEAVMQMVSRDLQDLTDEISDMRGSLDVEEALYSDSGAEAFSDEGFDRQVEAYRLADEEKRAAARVQKGTDAAGSEFVDTEADGSTLRMGIDAGGMLPGAAGGMPEI